MSKRKSDDADQDMEKKYLKRIKKYQEKLKKINKASRLIYDADIVQNEDCLHLQLYRDSKDRYKKGQTKASLSLQHFLGFESGFTLDKESNTIAIICQDIIVVLAFDTRERLIQWQVKISSNLGDGQQYLVLVSSAPNKTKVPAGPAKLHVQDHRFCMTSGVPPRLVGLWEIAHLRRYGVVEGRFCFEGGSHCGKGEGLHVVITDQGEDITTTFNLASQGKLAIRRRTFTSRKQSGLESQRSQGFRPDTRLSDLNTIDKSLPPNDLYEDAFLCDERGAVSPYWPSAEQADYDTDMGLGDTASVSEMAGESMRGTGRRSGNAWPKEGTVTLERCVSCMSKLGAMSRSSTTALTPGATQFMPAWTMESLKETNMSDIASNASRDSEEYFSQKLETPSCQCPPARPPKPGNKPSSVQKAPMPLPQTTCICEERLDHTKVGPYENYDIPKIPTLENGCSRYPDEYYDTPKRIKECLSNDLFKVTKNQPPGALVLKKPCGCVLKFGKKKIEPTVIECDETFQPTECPCQRVTSWANSWINIPYCKRTTTNPQFPNKENVQPNMRERNALYATVDISKKANRKSNTSEKNQDTIEVEIHTDQNYENVEPVSEELEEGPLSNYANLDFALSLEHYENAKDLLKRAGVTQNELDALSDNLKPGSQIKKTEKGVCVKCGHLQNLIKNKEDDYLMMEPSESHTRKEPKSRNCPPPGYTPMAPATNFTSHTLKNLALKDRVNKFIAEKSASNPALHGPPVDRSKKRCESDARIPGAAMLSSLTSIGSPYSRKQLMDSSDSIETLKNRKRSSSVESSRFLEDLRESDGSKETSSSLETLRDLALEERRSSTPCSRREQDCESCGNKSSCDGESSSKDLPPLRRKGREQVHIKRSSSVPCKSVPNRDSSSSNDSGVSSCSLRPGAIEFTEFELPLTTAASGRHFYGIRVAALHATLPRRSKSSDPMRDIPFQLHKIKCPAKSSSAEAEVPVCPNKQFKGIVDTHSTSSGTSDMSDYIETLSMSSSHSSSDTPTTLRINRQIPMNTLRPRSGKEYHNIDTSAIMTSVYKTGKELSNYSNLP